MARYTDDVMARNLYGAYEGATLGTTSTSPSAAGPATPAVAQDAAQAAAAAGPRGNPLAFWAMFLILLLGLMYVAQRVGESGEFANIKATAYNILVIGLVAVVAIPPIKLAASRVPIPALRDYVLAV